MIRRLLLFMLLLGVILPSGISCRKEGDPSPELTVSEKEIFLDFPGEAVSFSLSSNVPWTVDVRYPLGAEEGWLVLPVTSGESGDHLFEVRALENPGHMRETRLAFAMEGVSYVTYVTVRQQGKMEWDLTDQFDPYFAGFLLKNYTQDRSGITYGDAIRCKQLSFGSQDQLPPTFRGGHLLVNLESMSFWECTGTAVDLGGAPQVKRVTIRDCSFESLDISRNVELESLDVEDTAIARIDASQNPHLAGLSITGPHLNQDIEVVLGPGVRSFLVENRHLTVFDYQKATGLDWLHLRNCGVSSLDLRHTRLTYFSCESNTINELLLPETIEQVRLLNSAGEIPQLELGPAIRFVDVRGAGIKQILLKDAYQLESFDCIYNKLEGLDMSRAVFPSTFNIHFNPGRDGFFDLKVAPADYEEKAAEYKDYRWSWDNGEVYVRVTSS